MDPLWLAVVSTDVAICRRNHVAAKKFADDLAGMCTPQPGSDVPDAEPTDTPRPNSALWIPRSAALLRILRGRALLQQASEQVCTGELHPARMLLLDFFQLLPQGALQDALSAGLPRRLAPRSGVASSAGSDIKLLPCTYLDRPRLRLVVRDGALPAA